MSASSFARINLSCAHSVQSVYQSKCNKMCTYVHKLWTCLLKLCTAASSLETVCPNWKLQACKLRTCMLRRVDVYPNSALVLEHALFCSNCRLLSTAGGHKSIEAVHISDRQDTMSKAFACRVKVLTGRPSQTGSTMPAAIVNADQICKSLPVL